MGKSRKILRKVLRQKLNEGLDYPLTVVMAPIGYGKTTSVLDFLEYSDVPYLWLTIETVETSPEYIWDMFCRQLRKSHREIADLFSGMGFPETAPQRNRMLDVLDKNLINNHEKIILVVDDYHLNQSWKVNELIKFLARSGPDSLVMYIITRRKPAIGIEELLLKDRCLIVDEKDYQLSLKETGTMFKINRVMASSHLIENVHNKSEGWISAVYLLLSQYKQTGTIRSGLHIEGLIKSAIIPRYSREEVDVLTSISILEHFTLDQLCYVIQGEKTRQIAMDIMESSFIRYNEAEGTYTMHNIFRDYLQKHELPLFSENRRYELYKQAGLWYLKQGFIVEAIRSFMKIKEYQLILEGFKNPEISRLFYYYPSYVFDIFNEIPFQMKLENPLAYLCYLHYLVTTKNQHIGINLLEEMQEHYNADMSIETRKRNQINGEIEHVRSLAKFNNCIKMLEIQKNAYELLGGASKLARKGKVATMGSYSILFLYHIKLGHMEEVANYIHNNFKYYEYVSGGAGKGFEQAVMAEYCLHIGDKERASVYAMKAIERAKERPILDVLICAHFVQARLALSDGQVDLALSCIEKIKGYEAFESQTAYYTSIYKPYVLTRDWIHVVLGEVDKVSDILIEEPLDRNALFYQSIGTNYIVYGKLLMQQKKFVELEIHCQSMLKVLEPYHNQLGYIHAYLQLSRTYLYLNRLEEGQDYYNKAMRVGQADNLETLMIEYGEDLLLLIDAFGRDSQYENMLKKSTKDYVDRLNMFYHSEKEPSLTKREEEVMALLIKGKRNKEIASELFISESAVKKMLTSCYRKLGVKNRGMAIKEYGN